MPVCLNVRKKRLDKYGIYMIIFDSETTQIIKRYTHVKSIFIKFGEFEPQYSCRLYPCREMICSW